MGSKPEGANLFRLPGRGLRVLDFILSAILVVTTIGVPLSLIFVPFGANTYSPTPAELGRPFQIELADGSVIESPVGGQPSLRDLEVDEDGSYLSGPAEVRLEVDVSWAPWGNKGVLVLHGLALFVPLIIGVWCLSRIVKATRNGRAFSTENVRRLQVAAGAAMAIPLLEPLPLRLLDRQLSSPFDVDLPTQGPSVLTCAVIALGLLAIAEVFRQGVVLRELEQGTV